MSKNIGENVRCLLNQAYVQEKLAKGAKWDVVLNVGEDVLAKACVCPKHRPQTA